MKVALNALSLTITSASLFQKNATYNHIRIMFYNLDALWVKVAMVYDPKSINFKNLSFLQLKNLSFTIKIALE